MRRHHRELVRLLRAIGCTEVELLPGGRHPVLSCVFRGNHWRWPVPSTPGHPSNCVNSFFRRMRRDLRVDRLSI